jgi:hypothetical protein
MEEWVALLALSARVVAETVAAELVGFAMAEV